MIAYQKVIILAKHLDYIDIFLERLAINLLKYLSINKDTINLKNDYSLLYRLIYSFKLIEFEIFEYI